MSRLLLVLAMLGVVSLSLFPATAVQAADELLSFDTVEQRELFTALTHEYRCLKCQNQTIADSAADLAGDLRREIRDQVLAGSDRQQIDEYLLQRYGDFILYKPRLTPGTLFLWFAPFLLLIGGLAFGLYTAAQKKRLAGSVPADDLDKARSLLEK